MSRSPCSLQTISLPYAGRLFLSKGKREGLDTGIEELDLENRCRDAPHLAEELIHAGLPDLACAIGRGIGSTIVARRGAVHLYFEANRRAVLRRTQDHMEIAAVEPEHNLARHRFERGALGTDVPQSTESPLI